MKRCFTVIACLILLHGMCLADKVGLLPSSDSAGYVARLLINEVPFPGERGYVSEKDTQAAMRALVLVLHSRIKRVPPGYSRREIAYVDSDNVLDVITAGGVKGQMDGFYYSRGRPSTASRVNKRINNLLSIANRGEPGRFARLIRYAQGLASRYINGTVPSPDMYDGIRKISSIKVTGCAYGWMTDKDYYHPGGCFVRIPDSLKGRLGGNRFYTLKERRSVRAPSPKTKRRPVIIYPGGQG